MTMNPKYSESNQLAMRRATAHDILLVDNDVQIVDMVLVILEDAGYQVRTAYGGREAVREVQALSPGMILFDLLMPYFSGYDVLEHLRRSDEYRGPIVIFTANTVDEAALLRNGATELLRKPFMLPDLLACVARHMPHA